MAISTQGKDHAEWAVRLGGGCRQQVDELAAFGFVRGLGKHFLELIDQENDPRLGPGDQVAGQLVETFSLRILQVLL